MASAFASRHGLALVLLAACGGEDSASTAPGAPSSASSSASSSATSASSGGGAAGAGGGAPDSVAFDMPVVQPFDPARAAAGLAAFQGEALGGGWIPTLAIENLWIVWGGGPVQGDAYWSKFRERYGFFEAPFDNGGLPLGLRRAGGDVGFDCLMCHADRVAGETHVGVGNSRLDLQGLYDDLAELNETAPKYGYPSYPMPYEMKDRTAAAGANDAMGLGLWFASKSAGLSDVVHQTAGFQQAPAWWTVRFRDELYLDGSGSAGSHRTMMAMLLGSGATFAELQAKDALFEDIYQGILSLDPPAFTARPLEGALAARGREVFDATCAGCHGVHSGPGASFLGHVELGGGTDPVRAASFDAEDAAVINASWFGAKAPMHATGGYLAPPLRGVWATAPYLHNGSVPDLASVLDSAARPARWKRTGAELADYDAERGGWRYTTDGAGSLATIEGRKVYDTSRAGLSNAGHTYGDALSSDDRRAVLEYLLGL